MSLNVSSGPRPVHHTVAACATGTYPKGMVQLSRGHIMSTTHQVHPSEQASEQLLLICCLHESRSVAFLNTNARRSRALPKMGRLCRTFAAHRDHHPPNTVAGAHPAAGSPARPPTALHTPPRPSPRTPGSVSGLSHSASRRPARASPRTTARAPKLCV